MKRDYITAYFCLKILGCVKINYFPIIHDGYAITEVICFFHVVGCKYYGYFFLLVQILYIIPDVPSCLWIKTYSWLIEEEYFWMMHQSPCYFQTRRNIWDYIQN